MNILILTESKLANGIRFLNQFNQSPNGTYLGPSSNSYVNKESVSPKNHTYNRGRYQGGVEGVARNLCGCYPHMLIVS